jgi:hypothetical protein
MSEAISGNERGPAPDFASLIRATFRIISAKAEITDYIRFPRSTGGTAMKRRAFMALAGGAALSRPFMANAQQREPLRRIGAIIGFAENDPEVHSFINAFDKGLKELGWNDGGNVRIDYRYAAGDIGAMQRLTQEMVALRPDVIFASSTPITAALHRETQNHPGGVCSRLRSGGCRYCSKPLAARR